MADKQRAQYQRFSPTYAAKANLTGAISQKAFNIRKAVKKLAAQPQPRTREPSSIKTQRQASQESQPELLNIEPPSPRDHGLAGYAQNRRQGLQYDLSLQKQNTFRELDSSG